MLPVTVGLGGSMTVALNALASVLTTGGGGCFYARGPSIRSTVSAIKPIVGFGVDDHRIRELMRFAEITSREYSKEVVEYHGGSPNSKGWFS
jgi:hypothetical protein